MGAEYLRKLAQVAQQREQTDALGRRAATPAEVAALLSEDFSYMEPQHPPTLNDKVVKDEGDRCHATRKR